MSCLDKVDEHLVLRVPKHFNDKQKRLKEILINRITECFARWDKKDDYLSVLALENLLAQIAPVQY